MTGEEINYVAGCVFGFWLCLLVFLVAIFLICLKNFLRDVFRNCRFKKYGVTPFGNVYLDRLQDVSCKLQSGKKTSKDDLLLFQAFQYYIETGGFVGK